MRNTQKHPAANMLKACECLSEGSKFWPPHPGLDSAVIVGVCRGQGQEGRWPKCWRAP